MANAAIFFSVVTIGLMGIVYAKEIFLRLSGRNNKEAILPERQRLSNYSEIEIYYEPLTETLDEMRESYQSHTSTDDKRLPYWVKNLGDVEIRDCCIRMRELKVVQNLVLVQALLLSALRINY